MERKKSLSALLRSDAQTAKNITEMYPADWNMDAVYQKAYRTYREQAARTAAAPTPTARQNMPLHQKMTLRANRWITAACLMLTVGIAGGVAWMQMSVSEPPRTPPNESSAVTVPIEEILPEHTSLPDAEQATQTVTAAHSTAPAPSETRTETQTALPSPSGPTSVQQASDVPQTSADVPTEAETQPQPTAPQQTTSRQTAVQPTTTQPTTSKQTATQMTTTRQSTAQPTTTRLTTTRPTTTRLTTTQETATAATTVRTTTRPADTAPPQTTIPDAEYQPPNGNQTPPTDPDPSVTEPPLSSGDAPSGDAPSVNAPRLTVTDFGSEFSVAYDFEDQTVYPQPDFTVDLEGYTVTINRTDYSFSNLITNDETGVSAWGSFCTGARWQSPFKYSLYSYQETTVKQNGEASPAVLITGDTNCFLIWFDGRYLCELGIKTEYKDELFRIAEAMITH